jgi:hypothetical protein
MNRFERDDLDWVMGELAHALGCAQNAGKPLYEHDPVLCAEILAFFGEWQRWIAWNAIQWIRSA